MNDAKGTPMAKDAIFNIASMTKAVTSVGVMMLVDEGSYATTWRSICLEYQNPR